MDEHEQPVDPDDRRHDDRRWEDKPESWSIERKLLILTFVTSVLAFAFGLGVNWASIQQQQAEINALRAFNETSLPATYLRRDVYESDQKRLADAIDRLTDSIRQGQEEDRKIREWLKAVK